MRERLTESVGGASVMAERMQWEQVLTLDSWLTDYQVDVQL